MRKFWIFAMAAWWCGCQQTESRSQPAAPRAAEAPAPAPPSAPAQNDGRPVLACFGDSLTAGLGLEPGQTFPDLLQKELDRRGLRYRVVNLGVSGDTTQDGVARLPMVLAEKPAVVLLELGANDGLRGQPVSGTQSNLAQMIEALQQAGAKVVLAGITLPPNYGPQYIHQFDQVFLDLAAKYKLVRIPFLLAGVGGDPALMQKDGLHPNAEGTRIVAATVMKALEPVLK